MSSGYFKYKKLLTPPIQRAAYSDRTAWIMAEMSRLVYSLFEKDDTELKNALSNGEFELVRTFNCKGTQAFLAKQSSTKMAVLAFRGTQINEWKDFKTDIEARFYHDEKGAKIHIGFYKAFNCVELDVRDAVDDLADYALYVTGHSLGGALALIATRALNSDNLAACYTYGGPKVGNEEFGEGIRSPIYRVINAYDVVPVLPFSWLIELLYLLPFKIFKNILINYRGYQHYGDMRYISPGDKDIKVISNYNEIFRLIGLWFNKTQGVKCHSIEAYCEKLGQWALKRFGA